MSAAAVTPKFTAAQQAALDALGDDACCPDCNGFGLGPMEANGGDPYEPDCRSCEWSGLSDKAREAIRGAS